MEYKDQIKSPKWQKRRLEILKRDEFTCQQCGNKELTLHVHHKHYNKGAMIWDYQGWELTTLCETCHSETHEKPEKSPEDIVMSSTISLLKELNNTELYFVRSMLDNYVHYIKNSFDYDVLCLLESLTFRTYLLDDIKKMIAKEVEVEELSMKIRIIENRMSYMAIDKEKYDKYMEKLKEIPF
jgi:hypothetical protein